MCFQHPLRLISYSFIFLLILTNFIPNALCKLQCKNCNSQSSYSTKTILSFLTKNIDKQVCVWYSGEGGGKSVVLELLKDLSSSYSTITSFDSDQVDVLPQLCRHNVLVVNSSRSLGCRRLLAPGLPLSADHHFYILMSGSLSATDLDQCSDQLGYAHAAIISLHDTRVFTLSSPLFQPRRFLSSNLSSIMKRYDLTHVNLMGRPVNTASFNCSPFVIFRDGNDTETESITGIEWQVLKSIAKMLNFTIKLVKLKGDQRWGDLVKGNWTGGISRAIFDGDAEIAVCNMWYSLKTYQIMEFPSPINKVSFMFIAPRPKPLQKQWRSLVKIFDPYVWTLIVVTYLSCTFSYWLFCNLRCLRNRTNYSLGQSLMTMFGMLLSTSWAGKRPNSSVRQLITWWCVFGLLLTSTYNSSIASRLTLQRYEPRIDTLQQLVQQDFRWTDSPDNNRQKRSTYFNLANYWQREWEQRYVPVAPQRIKEALDTGKFAFPIQRWGDELLFFTLEGLDVDHDLENMRVVKETTFYTFETIKLAKRSPLLKAAQIALLKVGEAGLVSYWTSVAGRDPAQRFAVKLFQENENRAVAKQLGMKNLGPVFIVLHVGLLTSVVVFIIEVFCKRESHIPFRH